MKIDIPPVDKIRFINEDVLAGGLSFHTIEISDNRSLKHFVSLYCVGNDSDHRKLICGIEIKIGVSLRRHSPEIYHREGQPDTWVNNFFKDVDGKRWGKHYHWNLNGAPSRNNVKIVMDEMLWGVGKPMSDFILNHLQT